MKRVGNPENGIQKWRVGFNTEGLGDNGYRTNDLRFGFTLSNDLKFHGDQMIIKLYNKEMVELKQ